MPCAALAARFRCVETFASGEGWSGCVEPIDATDARGSRAALKILDHGHAPHEAALLQSLRHESIPRVQEVGETEDGRAYILRTFVEGSPLETGLPREPEEVLAVAVQLLEVLAFVHSRGILHRDVKPANVLIDEDGRAHLLDFGLGGRLGRGELHGGSLFHAAPERLLGAAPAPAHDLYALGVTLFEALGRPFRQPASSQAFRDDLLERGFLSAVAVDASDLPAPFDRVLGALLARDRHERVYGDAHDLLDALVRGSGRPSIERLRPDPVTLYAHDVAATLHALADAPSARIRITARNAEDAAALALHAASVAASDGIRLGITPTADALELHPSGDDRRDGPTLTLHADQVHPEDLAHHLTDCLGLPGDAAHDAARTYLDACPDAGGDAVFEWLRARAAAGDLVPDGPHWRWPDALAGRTVATGTVDETHVDSPEELRELAARGHVEAAVAAYRSMLADDANGETESPWRRALAGGLLDAGEPGRALAFCGDDAALRARALFESGRVGDAAELLERADETPDTERLRASVSLSRGETEAARRRLERLLATAPSLEARLIYGQVLMSGDEIGVATRWFEDLEAEVADGPPLARASRHTCLGELCRRRGDLDAARTHYEAARAETRALGHVRHVATATSTLGAIAKDRGEYDEAGRLHREAVRLFERAGDVTGAALAQANLGLTALAAGDPQQALERLEEAVAALESTGNAWHLPLIRLRRARALHALGRNDEARTALEELTALGLPRHLEEEGRALEADLLGRSDSGSRDERPNPRRTTMRDDHASTGPELEPALRTLRAINRRLAGEPSIDRVLESLIDAAVTLTGGRVGYLLVARGDSLRREYHCGGAQSLAFSRSLANRAVQQQRVQTASDAVDDPELLEMPSVRNLVQRSAVCVPFRGSDGHGGAIYVEHAGRPDAFGPFEIECLEGLADQAAIALRLLDHGGQEAETTTTAGAEPAQRRRRPTHVVKMLGNSPAMTKLRHEIDRVARSDLAILIRGETGTGKELVAREIHERSARSRGPFIALNCSAIPEQLMESELFGHVRGAFTGADTDRTGLMEAASGGTLFLDEIGDMPSALQAKLLRAIQDRSVRRIGASETVDVDTRIVSATHKDLSALVGEGSFREDLYYRIVGVEVGVPPLRSRGDDIELLAASFIERWNREHGRNVHLSADARAALRAHRWPGNVRELQHTIERAHLLCDGDELHDLGLRTTSSSVDGEAESPMEAAVEVPSRVRTLREVESRAIRDALRHTGGDKSQAARELGISRTALYDKLRRMEKDGDQGTGKD